MYRDRHGRGLTGNLLPLKNKNCKSAIFDNIALRAFNILDNRCGTLLDTLDLAITDVPNCPEIASTSEVTTDGEIILSKYVPTLLGKHGIVKRAKIILYRFPLEARANNRQELLELLLEVLAQQIARYLDIDKNYLLNYDNNPDL